MLYQLNTKKTARTHALAHIGTPTSISDDLKWNYRLDSAVEVPSLNHIPRHDK